jgi:hypothetical protein
LLQLVVSISESNKNFLLINKKKEGRRRRERIDGNPKQTAQRMDIHIIYTAGLFSFY